jgi:acetyl-CoA synthetase
MTSRATETSQIDTLLTEERQFPPPPEFSARATATNELYERARRDRLAFWADEARSLDWIEPWRHVLDWKLPHARWFEGGKLNAAANCVDRHLTGPRRNKVAIIWEGEPGDRRAITYWELAREVGRCANALRRLGVKRGDRVAIYLPMIPEAAIAMLACARIGAAHSVVFGGFSAESLRDRINDASAVCLITADGGYRRGQIVPLKQFADEALTECPSIRHCVVVQRRLGQASGDWAQTRPTGLGESWRYSTFEWPASPPGSAPNREVPSSIADMTDGRDHWWHDLLDRETHECPAEAMDAEDVLFILYTSGTTGKPKGIVHTTGGYLTQVSTTTKYVFDLREDDVFWCTADVGWVTGHSYVVYGPLSLGATVLMYEGAPDWPQRDRFWGLIARYGVTVFYTAPTAIRAFMKWGPEHPSRHDLSTLRLLGSVGEPINPEAWIWYHEHIGGSRCPIVDTWWQTETGGIMISPLPGVTTTRPGSATIPLPGVSAELVDAAGTVLERGGGFLTLSEPWPGMLRTIWGDDQRYRETYWSRFPGRYFAGDGAKVDADGYWWVLGRVDDVLNVAGHRIGTMEVESALVDHPAVAEAAVVGKHHDLKGQAIAAFVTLKEGRQNTPTLKDDLKEHVTKKIGAIARPDDILFSADLPKTRSGKIMRRLLRDIAEGKALGDTTTLADPAVVARLKEMYEGQEG